MIKAVIFDMDGLIIDSEPIQSEAFSQVIKAYGKTPILNKNGLVMITGIRADDNWKIIKEKYQIDEDISILRDKRRIVYINLLKNNLKAMPGLYNLLTLLQNKQIKMALVSSSTLPNILFVLEGLKIKEYFEIIISGDDVTKGKPDPECFILGSKRLDVKPENCLVLEDAESGVIAGKAAGMKVIAVPNQYTKNHDFSLADKVVDSLEKIDSKFLRSL